MTDKKLTIISILLCCLALAFIMESAMFSDLVGYRTFPYYAASTIVAIAMPFIFFKLIEIILTKRGYFKENNNEK